MGPCKYCRNDGYGAMFTDEIWEYAKIGRGLCCVPCMERILKRKLRTDDLVWCALTWADPFVAHLRPDKTVLKWNRFARREWKRCGR